MFAPPCFILSTNLFIVDKTIIATNSFIVNIYLLFYNINKYIYMRWFYERIGKFKKNKRKKRAKYESSCR